MGKGAPKTYNLWQAVKAQHPQKYADIVRVVKFTRDSQTIGNDVIYCAINRYFTYLDHTGIEDVSFARAVIRNDSIELNALTNEEEVLASHTIALDPLTRRPEQLPQGRKRIGLLEILYMQGSLNEEAYQATCAEYKRKRKLAEYKRERKPKEVNPLEVRLRLQKREQELGRQANTATNLGKSYADGGNFSLLSAIRTLSLPSRGR